MKKAIVTGGMGFVGMNLILELLKKDYFVYVITRPGSGHNDRIQDSDSLRKIALDIHNFQELPNYINESCDIFFHLAWQGQHNDYGTQRENIDFTINAVKVAATLGCKRIVSTGSQAEYGICEHLITEDSVLSPITAYGAAKVAACFMSRTLASDLHIEWVWGRIFSIYGKYEPPTTLISYLVSMLKERKKPELSTAVQFWDYLYSEDVGRALLALAESGQSGEIYNIANGDYKSLKEFTEEVRTLIAPEITIQYGAKSFNGVTLKPSVEKIYKDTGWRAEVSFIDGIRKAYL